MTPVEPDLTEPNTLIAHLTATIAAPASYTVTADAITVVTKQGCVHTVPAGTPQYAGLKQCILHEAWADLPNYLTQRGALQAWLGSDFTVGDDGQEITDVTGRVLPREVSAKVIAMSAEGQDPTPLLNFYKRLNKNPSKRSVDQLFTFLGHLGIPLESEGTFLTYKGVRKDFLDQHSGTLLNTPGTVQKMPRNQISDDPNTPCHEGLHVGALGYARSFASRVVICRIDPEHVVCVPYDCSAQKMRVCQYEVIGQWVGQDDTATMPSAVATSADLSAEFENPFEAADWGGEVEFEDDLGKAEIVATEAPATTPLDDDDVIRDDFRPIHTKTPVAVSAPSPAKTGPKAATFNRKSPAELMAASLADLRIYANRHLKIVGAGHLPGGKSMLVKAILKARRKKARS